MTCMYREMQVLLDSMDGGAQENILLEGGPQFSDPSIEKGGKLHCVDQAVIMALCLDVSNSNPVVSGMAPLCLAF